MTTSRAHTHIHIYGYIYIHLSIYARTICHLPLLLRRAQLMTTGAAKSAATCSGVVSRSTMCKSAMSLARCFVANLICLVPLFPGCLRCSTITSSCSVPTPASSFARLQLLVTERSFGSSVRILVGVTHTILLYLPFQLSFTHRYLHTSFSTGRGPCPCCCPCCCCSVLPPLPMLPLASPAVCCCPLTTRTVPSAPAATTLPPPVSSCVSLRPPSLRPRRRIIATPLCPNGRHRARDGRERRTNCVCTCM